MERYVPIHSASPFTDRAVPNDEMFLAKLVESDGNIRVFERSLRNSLM